MHLPRWEHQHRNHTEMKELEMHLVRLGANRQNIQSNQLNPPNWSGQNTGMIHNTREKKNQKQKSLWFYTLFGFLATQKYEENTHKKSEQRRIFQFSTYLCYNNSSIMCWWFLSDDSTSVSIALARSIRTSLFCQILVVVKSQRWMSENKRNRIGAKIQHTNIVLA